MEETNYAPESNCPIEDHEGCAMVPWRVNLLKTFFLGGLAFLGCRTADQSQIHVDGDDMGGRDPKAQPLQTRTDIGRVPPSLWSPAQRRSTAAYYFMVGEYVAMKEHDPRKALRYFDAAYGLDPNPYLGGKTLVAKASAGERAEALLDARKMVLLYPRASELRYFYGEMLADADNLDEAVLQLEKCVELDPKSESAYLLLSDVYRRQNDLPKAITVAKEFARSASNSVAAWSLLSRLYLITGNKKDALVPARRAWEMQSNNPQLAQIYAIALQLNGKTQQAVRIYEQLYRLDPTDDELTQRMVGLYRELGNLESAVKLLDEMAQQGGETRPAIQMQKALLLWELKKDAEASVVLEKLVAEYPESDRVKFLAAFAAERIGKPDRALDLYRAIPTASSLRQDATVRTIALLQKLKRMDEAIELGRQSLAQGKPSWELYGVVGGVFGDAERYEDAIRTFDTGFQQHPDRPRLLFMKGVYQEKSGDRDGCIKTMREVIAKDPQNSSAFNYLGYLFAERNENLDEAETLIKRALEIKPDDGFYLDSLGWVYFQKGQFDKALDILRQAAEKEPEEGVIYEHWADALLKKGDVKGAKERFEQALKAKSLEPKDRERIEKKVKDLPSGG